MIGRARYHLLTASGKDRPGIVAGVAKAVYELGGNIEDASMTRLGGEFTMMLVVGIPAKQTPASLAKALKPFQKKLALTFSSRPIPPALARNASQKQPRYMLSVYGTDKPGIVHRIAQALADHKISITDLNTRILQRPAGGVYVMLLEIQVPDGFDMDPVRGELDALRQELDVEITLQDLDAVAL
jgi:glycine cleavage system transcriptional repressor